jgi:hypothetical protein
MVMNPNIARRHGIGSDLNMTGDDVGHRLDKSFPITAGEWL